MVNQRKLGTFLAEVANWRWDEFVKAEKDDSYTTNQSIIFALIRGCALENLAFIKVALNRLEGKLKTPVIIEYPKVYWLFPYAQNQQAPEKPALVSKTTPTISTEVDIASIPDYEDDANNLPSLGLRETLSRMSDFPRDVPQQIADLATQVDQANRGQGSLPADIPVVKSVMAAHLLIMAQKRDIAAATEVFDQIDGKLAETIQILGDDLYLTSYAKTAPEGSYLNENGVLQFEAEQVTNTWAAKLGKPDEKIAGS